MLFLIGGNELTKRQDLDAGRACYMTCSSGEKCGGTWAISLYKQSAAAAPAPSTAPVATSSAAPVKSTAAAAPSAAPSAPATGVPTGWSSIGCISDGNNRAFPDYMFQDENMTTAMCLSTCDQKGFTYAGIEYDDQCWCTFSSLTIP